MKFLNWMGVTHEDLRRIPQEIGNDKMMFVVGISAAYFAIRIFWSLPQ